MRLECTEDVALPATTIVGFYRCSESLFIIRRWSYQVCPFEGLGTLWTQLI